MQKIKSVHISYWFKKLEDNPSLKVYELEKELSSLFHTDFLYNKESTNSKFGMPRIQVLSNDKKYFFSMSLINANLIIEILNDEDFDEVILEINNNIQLFFDTLKEIYHLHIIYTSVKIQIIDDKDDGLKFLTNKLGLKEENYESFSLKKGLIKGDYYINYGFDVCKEYNFNLVHKNLTGQDVLDSTMLISLSEAEKKSEYILIIIEINDRYIYNIDANHETSKSTIRGMILEIKDILKKDLY